MSRKLKRERFNHNILPELIEKFEVLTEELPCSKCVVLEAALKCYMSLSRNEQLLWTLTPEVQKIIQPNLISSEAAKAAREDESAAARAAGVRKRKKGQHAHKIKSL